YSVRLSRRAFPLKRRAKHLNADWADTIGESSFWRSIATTHLSDQRLLLGSRAERGEQLVPRGLNDLRTAAVLTEHLVSACDDLRIPVLFLRRPDHPHDSPKGAERRRVVECRRPKLRIVHAVRGERRLGCRRAEDGVPKHRQTCGVDSRLVLIER